MGKVVKYDAFISYRHCEPDREIAVRLQKILEGYRLPKDVAQKYGRTRLRRIFRDDSELAVSDDLSEEINKALLHSRFLIVICSPEYLKSVWCSKELETFLLHNDKKHVLLVLADGEPDEAFPPVMYSDGTEPLAADCRGKNARERKRLADTAATRLIASILGVRYDDLEQRQRRARNIRRTIRVMIAFSVLLTILGISMFFLYQISLQNMIIMQRYADSLAAVSANLLGDGRRTDAVYAARQALRDTKTDSFSELATQALVRALGIYDLPGFNYDDEIILPFSASNYFDISASGHYAGIYGLDHVCYVMDLTSGEIIYTCDSENYNAVVFDGDKGVIYRGNDGYHYYYDFDSKTETSLGEAESEAEADGFGNGYVFLRDQSIAFCKGPQIICDFDLNEVAELSDMPHDIYCRYAPDGNRAYVFYREYGNGTVYVFEADLIGGTIRHVELADKGTIVNSTADMDSVVWTARENGSVSICIQDIDSVSSVKCSDIQLEDSVDVLLYGNDVVVCTFDTIYILDRNLELIKQIDTSDFVSNTSFSYDGIAVYTYGGGVYLIKDGDYVYMDPGRANTDIIQMKLFRSGTLFLIGTGDNLISTYRYRDSEYITSYEGNCHEVMIVSYDDEDTLRFRQTVLDSDPGFDDSRIYDVTLCENADIGIIQLWDRAAYFYNTKTYECLKIIYALDGTVSSMYYDEAHGYYYISTDGVEVFDRNLKKVYEIPSCMLKGIDPETGNPVVMTFQNDEEYEYMARVLSYEEIIRLADDLLGDYVPDERVREKYSLE